MQLSRPRRLPVVLLAAVTLTPSVALAGTEAKTRITIFEEPSNRTEGITVIHPQTDVSAALTSRFDLSAGYEVDIVSGATPALFGVNALTSMGVDAVTKATEFSDIRHQVRGGLAYNRPDSGFRAAYSYGWESDYRSHAVSATAHSDVLDHNFTLSLAYTHNFDAVCDNDNVAFAGQPLDRKALISSQPCFTADPSVVTHRLHIDTIEPSLTWTVTPRLVLQGGTTVQIADGFQSNPYRMVLVGSQQRTPQESHPRFRQRFALWGGGALFFPRLKASALASLRLYRDTWGLQAATAEMNANKYLTQVLIVGLRARVHAQQGAAFYRDAVGYRTLGPAGQYWTGDRELSPMSNLLAGGKLAYVKRPQQGASSWYSEIELAAKAEVLFYRPASDYAPNSDRKQAYILQGAAAVEF